MPENEPSNNGRVTNTQLQLELKNIRQEQKTEHVKTRAIVAVLVAAGNAKALSFLLGAVGIDWWRGVWPW